MKLPGYYEFVQYKRESVRGVQVVNECETSLVVADRRKFQIFLLQNTSKRHSHRGHDAEAETSEVQGTCGTRTEPVINSLFSYTRVGVQFDIRENGTHTCGAFLIDAEEEADDYENETADSGQRGSVAENGPREPRVEYDCERAPDVVEGHRHVFQHQVVGRHHQHKGGTQRESFNASGKELRSRSGGNSVLLRNWYSIVRSNQ